MAVFATEHDAVQVTWGRAPAGPVTVTVGDRRVTVEGEGGAGAVRIAGLPPATDLEVQVRGVDESVTLPTRTQAPPPGAELVRFCTLSDMHLGETAFGLSDTMRERPRPEVAYPVRCTEAALAEAADWGASHVVVKGDITCRGRSDEYLTFRKVLDAGGLPWDAIPGNHETKSYREIDPEEGFRSIDAAWPDPVRHVDLPGLRVVLVDTTVDGHHAGHLDRSVDAVCDLVAGRRALVVLHHHPQRFRLPYFWPPGIPPAESEPFLAAVRRAATDVLTVAGHTHRHRRYERAGVTVCETGSPKDYPGTWTGYAVHEGGIRQVVLRVQRPDCIAWTEYTRWAALRTWGRWSPGTLDDRCFTLAWG